ncbi:sensor histidine kinase, partial [Sutcliffiella deserti]|uniref:sensor histidine kinase n=1 Tax=Sutcliffiella deserti TaxID=2875501 RepID=UPI0021E07138
MAKPGAPIFQKIYLEDILAEIPYNHSQSHLFKYISMKVDLERTPIMVDSKQMKQVLYNLVRNSCEAMDGEGIIHIYSKQNQNYYQLYIKDTGSGIQAGIEDSIFNPFSTSKETGTGLGLTIVQRIIENHNGRIEV